MKLEVSIGEAVDKLCILEIKMKKISDENKKIEIQKEIDVLKECAHYKSSYNFYYNILMYVNEKIWDMTDIIKSIEHKNDNFSIISNQIFEFNQKRFRIKNWFNLLTNSNIKEQKSYSLSHCKIIVECEDLFFEKLAEINYLSLQYDVLTFESPINDKIRAFLKIPNIIYDEEEKKTLNSPKEVLLSNFLFPPEEPIEVFSLKPISYLAGAMFGDFIQSLSVICEKFYETGRKGTLYISEKGDIFRNGLVNTYNDTYPVIIAQKYIHDFKIYDTENFDIDLTSWRSNSSLFIQNWYHTYKQTYNVEWGKHKWLDVPCDEKWKDKVIINTTNYKWPQSIKFNLLKEKYKDDLLFISSDKTQHVFFENKTNINIEYYQLTTFLELVTLINSCKLFVGTFSGPLAIANALHKNRIINYGNYGPDNVMNYHLENFLPNIKYNKE